MDFKNLTIRKINTGLKKGDFSAEELFNFYIQKIKEKDSNIFSYLDIFEEMGLSEAKNVDKKIALNEEISLLSGVPCAIKDNILVKGKRCTAGSKILENYIAPYDSTVIKKLKSLNAVFLGKTNLDEFAMGSSTENSAYGVTKNPKDLSRVPGGSSGGSAACVSADLCCFALGSDTGGSIRQPASFCGVVGLKPTYGTISRYGLIAYASSLDQIGPLTKNIEDAKIVFNVLSGKDPLDSTSMDKEIDLFDNLDIKNIKIGVPKEYFIEGLDKEVEEKIRSAIKKYEKMGAKIIEVSLPYTEYALPAYYIISTSEASANLARFDGIKYGYSFKPEEKEKFELIDVYLKSRGMGFGKEVKRRIMLGTYSLSSGYYDAYYKRALKVRTKIVEDFKKVFEKVDCLLTPTSPFTAFKIGEKINDPLSMYLSDIYTVPTNLAGLPAVSVPCGEISGLPVGLQIIGKPFEENKILNIANLIY